MQDFFERMKEHQIKYKAEVLGIAEMGASKRGNLYAHLLPKGSWDYNLWEGIRNEARSYFGAKGIAWHDQNYNLLSSQALCINVFFLFRRHLDILGKFISQYFTDLEKVIDLDFEYIGPKNYFKERGGRGQNRTSSDVAVLWLDKEKRGRMLLLEFKFTETGFGECGQKNNPLPKRCLNSSKVISSPQRECYRAEVGRTYWSRILSSDSPFRKELLTAESFCPFRYDFYQLMRNQLLAHCIQSDPSSCLARVDFGVFYHSENQALVEMPHPFSGERNPLKAWPKVLKNPDTFHTFTMQDFLKTIEPYLSDTLLGWRSYLKQRYVF